jgi:hypothetical protein
VRFSLDLRYWSTELLETVKRRAEDNKTPAAHAFVCGAEADRLCVPRASSLSSLI